MGIIKLKKVLNLLLFSFILAAFLFSYTTEVNATSLNCLPTKNYFIAAYNQGAYVEGVAIEYKPTGKEPCEVLPAMSESDEDLSSLFLSGAQSLNQLLSTGVYQLSTQCKGGWDTQCSVAALEKLTDNPAEFGKYKSEWQLRVKEAPINLVKEKWTVAMLEIAIKAIILGIILTAIFWPWVILWLKGLTKRLWLLFILAIIVQVILRFLLAIGEGIVFVARNALAISITIQAIFLIYLIYKAVRMKKSVVS